MMIFFLTLSFDKQQKALKDMPESFKSIETFKIPLRPYNVTGLENVRSLLKGEIRLNHLSLK